jgi:16S rRNA (cytidine1402-2'-O)-methyltransferase
VAFSSDAGTPGISDPGALLVAEARKVGIIIVPIPGVSAVATAMSVAGIRETPFTFYGFLPHKKGRQKILDTLLAGEYSIMLYESPHRFIKLLVELQERVLAGAVLEVTICRELTKIYEDIRVGTPAELIEHYADYEDQIRGEFVLIIRKI